MSTYVLVNEEGDRQVVDSASSTDGELAALLDNGYDFAEESGDAMVAMLADDGTGTQTVDHVPARNLLAYQQDMASTTGRRPLIITSDSGVREYVDNIRNMEARAARVRELSNSWEGLGMGLLSGVGAPIIAGNQLIRQMRGLERTDDFFGHSLSELSEARPFAQTAGNILGIVGTGGAGLIGGAAIRGAQLAGRFGASRAGQMAAGIAVEESLWAVGQAIPLAMMQQQPQLSAEALLGGAAFGGAVGLVFSPFLRAAWRARRAGETQIFQDIATTPGRSQMGQLIELNRNPPFQDIASMNNPRADRLASLATRLGWFPSAGERLEGAPFGGSLGVAAHQLQNRMTRRRLQIRKWAHGLSDEDLARYEDELFIRDNSIPGVSVDPAERTIDSISRNVRDTVIEPRMRRFEELTNEATQGGENLVRNAYRNLVRSTSSPSNVRVATNELGDSLLELLARFTGRTETGQREFMEHFTSETANALRDSSDFLKIRNARRGAISSYLPFGRRMDLLDSSGQDSVRRILNHFHNLDYAVQRSASDEDLAEELFGTLLDLKSATAGLNDDIMPGISTFQDNLSEVFAGTRSAKELNSTADASGRSIFSDEVHNRMRTVNAAYASQKRGGSYRRLLEKFEQQEVRPGDAVELSARKLQEKLSRVATNPEEYERFSREMVADIEDIDRISTELADLLGKADDDAARAVLGDMDDLSEMLRIEGNRGIFKRHSDGAASRDVTSIASHGFAQAFGGFVGTLVHPLLGWATGGAAAVASLSMRQVDRNPAQALMVQGRIRNQLLDYEARLSSGTAKVGSRFRSAARVARQKGARGTRIAARGLGYAILSDKMSRDQRVQQYNSLRERFNELAGDPIALTDELEMSLSTVDVVSPEVAHYMRERAVVGVQYISQSMIPPTVDPLSTQLVEVPPSMAEVDAFTRRFRALQDPLSLLDDLAAGVVTAEAAETVRVVYPNVMADISASIGQEIMEMGPDAAHIPYQMRTNLSLMLGTPTHTTLDGSFVRAMNERFAQTPQQAAAQGLSRMRTRRLNVSSGFMTEGQALSER